MHVTMMSQKRYRCWADRLLALHSTNEYRAFHPRRAAFLYGSGIGAASTRGPLRGPSHINGLKHALAHDGNVLAA